ncbi:MAG: GNAT family N-acetyltransferase [Candidatus Competibacter sp.]|nr:GNAT family N-acetyltransferase [Candidatus Competibacter sp.]
MKIRPLNASELPAYDALARRHGTLFNTTEWLALFGDQMQALGIFDNGDNLVGGLSLYRERRWGLKIIRRAPFTPTCGPFLEVKARNPVAIIEERRKALDCLIDYIEEETPALCMLSLDRNITDALPCFWRGYKIIPNYTYLLDLTASLDQIYKNMSPTRRNDMTKATRDGLIVRQISDFDSVRDLVLATFDRQRKFVDRACLEAILFRYAHPANSFAFSADQGDDPIAACFVVHDAETAYYLLGGYSEEKRHHGAGALALFEAIKYAQQLGLKRFDFEGSVIPAIERYFRGFGGKLTLYLTVNKGWLPIEVALKFIKRNIF